VKKLLCTSLIACVFLALTMIGRADGADPKLAHMVYFKLKDSSPAAKEKLVEACQKYLSGHEGAVAFAVGVLAEDLKREVNDRDFDVSLHLVFENKAAHDTYATHPRHQQFIEENKANWDKVRVFDSYLARAESVDRTHGERNERGQRERVKAETSK
jgi:hypothetical protein